ncbi:MAG: zinc ribbon domain-containing protein [Oscillospiraceae bacterium]|nr:zinc ribbon domain-containing protein [Oscillospiraceae bacterium]
MYCENCGKEVSHDSAFCENCGHKQDERFSAPPSQAATSRKGTLRIYRNKQWAGMMVKVKIYKNGVYAGEIGNGGALTLDIEKDCLIEFKQPLQKEGYTAKSDKDQNIQIKFDVTTGFFALFGVQ